MKLPSRPTTLALLVCALLLPSASALAQATRAETDRYIATNIGDPVQFQIFFADLKQAVQKHDAATVAALVSYPITINPRTKSAKRIRSAKAFIAGYDSIVTPHIAEVIEKQKYENLFVNYRGAMFGSGEVWVIGVCKDKECKQRDIRIETIQNTSGAKKHP
ncbi:MAG: hypothetical protein JST61_00460 [Acidobacteria bacterium]|nr:hypothetical protein [Acidobacteriota bacterium]